MSSAIREFVMQQPLFSHHDHHVTFADFDKNRETYGAAALLGYAGADLTTAAGARPPSFENEEQRLAALWPNIRTTGYGRAVTLGCQALFGLEFAPEHFAQIGKAVQAAIKGKTAEELFDYFVREKANIKWVAQDGLFRPERPDALRTELYPDYYHFAFRSDALFGCTGMGAIHHLQRFSGIDVLNLDRLVDALNVAIDSFKSTGRLNAFKVGIAYQRDLVVLDPPRYEAERAFSRLRSTKTFRDGLQQNDGAVNAAEGRPLGDYMLHRLLERAHDEDIPVQIHTGYLAGNWGSLAGTKASFLIPLFDKYREVRFDIFHASWPWASELGTIAKNYPNVYPDMCWMWTMNPAECERALGEWLDGVPFNKIFAFGADTGQPWCDVGYALQARIGIARVLEQKIEAGYFSEATARDVAAAIMLQNGESFYGLG
ncbi:MAG: amidohydrolase family protein [Kiritimatiellae bacterium]|nr:amidohydrolase family protein [Kiritimatiellia bacterium]